jgi:uncharacterized protein
LSVTQHLPPNWTNHEVAAVVGLLSDTHLPDRRRSLPSSLAAVFSGADLLLHAGDVGDLRVLDELSALAPVIAVHGNDDSTASQANLPYQQVVVVGGRRILLWHSHYPNRSEELDSRAGDDMLGKLQRTVDRAQQAGASIAVFGHWHIPFVYRSGNVTVINPGALASGNAFTRMLRYTVALLFVRHDGAHHITHIDLAAPHAAYDASLDFEAGFAAAMARYSESIVTPDVEALLPHLRRRLADSELLALQPIVSELGHTIWEGEAKRLTLDDCSVAFHAAASRLDPDLTRRVLAIIEEWRANARQS